MPDVCPKIPNNIENVEIREALKTGHGGEIEKARE